MSPNLRLALADWLAWAESEDWNLPSPDGIRYSVRVGLCSSVWKWEHLHGISARWKWEHLHGISARWKWEHLHGISASDSVTLYHELETIFEKDGLNPVFPFDKINFFTYYGPRDPARIAWVRKTLREKP